MYLICPRTVNRPDVFRPTLFRACTRSPDKRDSHFERSEEFRQSFAQNELAASLRSS
jgi:hypothetical protein